VEIALARHQSTRFYEKECVKGLMGLHTSLGVRRRRQERNTHSFAHAWLAFVLPFKRRLRPLLLKHSPIRYS